MISKCKHGPERKQAGKMIRKRLDCVRVIRRWCCRPRGGCAWTEAGMPAWAWLWMRYPESSVIPYVRIRFLRQVRTRVDPYNEVRASMTLRLFSRVRAHRPPPPSLPCLPTAMLVPLPRSWDDLASTLRMSRRSFLRLNRSSLVVVSLACFATFFYLVNRLPPIPASTTFQPVAHPPIWNPALFTGYGPSINSIQTTDELTAGDWAGMLPPDDPPLSSLPLRHEWTPELEHPPPNKPPVWNPYPQDKLSELFPAEGPGRKDPPEARKKGKGGRALSSFASSWRAPKMGPAVDAPRVQAQPSAFSRSKERERLTEGRREVVRNAFLVAWEGYKRTSYGCVPTTRGLVRRRGPGRAEPG